MIAWTYTKGSNEPNEQCALCNSALREGDKIYFLPPERIVHKECGDPIMDKHGPNSLAVISAELAADLRQLGALEEDIYQGGENEITTIH